MTILTSRLSQSFSILSRYLRSKPRKQASGSVHYSKLLKTFLLTGILSALVACGGAPNSTGNNNTGGGTTSGTRIGSTSGTGFNEGDLNIGDATLQAGASTTITIDIVDANDVARTIATAVTVTSQCIASELSTVAEQGDTDGSSSNTFNTSTGQLVLNYTANGCTGTDAITATATIDGTQITATSDIVVSVGEVLAVEFVSAAFSQLSLAGIGGTETTRVTFRLVGAQSAPIVGQTVTFAPGSTIGGISLAEGTESGVTDNNGEVTTVLQSGTVATSVRVIATYEPTNTQGLSEDIVISTGVPVARRFSLSLSEFNPLNASNSDGISVTLNVIASDQFGNDAPDGTRVSFITPESGNVDSSCVLQSGRCSVEWVSSNPRPADLRASVIAYTSGAEDYIDTNGNNVFDSADSGFTDLPEACVDIDEDGVCEIADGELFVDFNENTILDGGDGVWNGPCLEAANSQALCPGAESVAISETAIIVMPLNTARIFELGNFPAVGSPIDIGAGAVGYSGLFIADSNTLSVDGNPMANGTTIEFQTSTGNLVGTSSFTVPSNATRPTGGYGIVLEPGDPVLPGTLSLIVTPPGQSPTQFLWPIIVGTGGAGDGGEQMGSGTGVSFVPNVLASSVAGIIEAGGSSSISVNIVDADNNPVTNAVQVTFESDCQQAGFASFDNGIVTTIAGSASVEYTALGCVGTDTIRAQASVGGSILTSAVDVVVAADEVLAIEFVSSEPSQLTLAGIGGTETSRVTFTLTGSQGAPVIGQTVDFELSSTVGGVSLAVGSESDVSNNAGQVSTVVQSGSVSTSVSVTATHDNGGVPGVRGESQDIIISTGIPVQSRFTVSLSEFNPAQASGANGVEVELSVIASDQFGNDAPDGTRIFFAAPESGNIDSSCEILSGECSATWISSSPRPDDMRASVIAYTSGAEDFIDTNGNNVFDADDVAFFPGDGAEDLDEACVDENANGTCDFGAGEFFVDFNEDRAWTTKNGLWDGPCLTSVDSRALCPGNESVIISRVLTIVMPFETARIWDQGDFPAPGSTIDLTDGDPDFYSGLRIADSNTNAGTSIVDQPTLGNPMSVGTTIQFSTTNGSIVSDSNFTVPGNVTRPTGPYFLIIEPDGDTNASGILTLEITSPGSDTVTTYFWRVLD